jgi:hypothetical protein
MDARQTLLRQIDALRAVSGAGTGMVTILVAAGKDIV